MARTDRRRNVILIFSRDPAAAAATAWKCTPVEIDTVGVAAIANASTGNSKDDVRNKVVQDAALTTGTPEGSAFYPPEEIFHEVVVPEHQLGATPGGNLWPGS